MSLVHLLTYTRAVLVMNKLVVMLMSVFKGFSEPDHQGSRLF